METLTIKTPCRCPQLHRPHPRLLAPGKPRLHHPGRQPASARPSASTSPTRRARNSPMHAPSPTTSPATPTPPSSSLPSTPANPAEPGQPNPTPPPSPHSPGSLAEQGITIRDGLLVGDTDCLPVRRRTQAPASPCPVSSTQTSEINAEFVYRGSFIEPTDRITLPTTSQAEAKATAVEHHMETIRSQPDRHGARRRHGRSGPTCSIPRPSRATTTATPWLQTCSSPPSATDSSQTSQAWTNPCSTILFAQTDTAPQWSRIEWAQQLLLHAYTRTSARTRSTRPHRHRLHQLVGRQRQQSPPIPPTRPRHRPRLPPRPPQRPNDRLRHRRRLEHEPGNCI